ncbi:MAG: hypothetical protein J0M29_04165 [Chitinophagales bacterium]|nr:hypothetical protein [Chitinophagales bacterium]
MPLPFASIVATDCQDAQVIAYTNTSEKGVFHLTIKTDCDSITVTARSLGYHKHAKRLAIRDLTAPQNFVLSSAVFQEVLVRAKTPPVIARNDTTEYNVASFSDSTEVSVEDLLKKLPGVRVTENGLITYNGKTVERVMIDGDDLFSQNYTLATRNIRADLISKVQVIDRFQENPLMKGIQESDRMVMNLKIKPDRKRALSGSLELGGGYGDEWKGRARTNLFSLSRKEKIYLIGNANNSGDNVLSEVEWTAGGGFQGFSRQQTLQANPLQPPGVLPNPPLTNAGLPSIYTQANRSGLMYIGLVLPSSPSFKTKISGWVGKVGLRQESGNMTQYLLDNTLLEIKEVQKVKKQSETYNLQVESEYFPSSKKHAIRSFFKVSNKPIQHNFNLLRSQTGASNFLILSQSDQKTIDLFGAFEYTFKQGESSAFQIVSKFSWLRGRYELLPQYNFYPSFFGIDTSFNRLEQTAMQEQGESIIMLRWLARIQKIQWQLESGVDWNWGNLTSGITLKNGLSEEWNPGKAYQNNTALTAPKYFAHLSAARNFGLLLVRARLNTSYRPTRLDASDSISFNPGLWAAEPRFDLKYNLSEHAVLSSYYNFQQELPNLTDLRPNFVFSDYQLTTRGLPNFALMPGHQAGLYYSFNQKIRQYNWNLGGTFSQKDNQFGVQYQIDPFISIQEKFQPVRRISYGLNGSFERYFRPIRSRFEMGFSTSLLKETAKINQKNPINLSQNLYSVNFGYGTAFDTWVNVVLSSRVAQINGQNDASDNQTRSTNWFSTAQINIRPNKVFDMKIFVHQVTNQISSQPSNVAYASDCVAYLRLKKWRSTVEFSAVNLLGSRQYEQVFADAFSQSISNVQAIQRFFLVSWEISF